MESSDYLTSSRLSLRSSQQSYLFVLFTVNNFVRLEGEYNSLNLMQNLLCPLAGLLRRVFIKKHICSDKYQLPALRKMTLQDF